MVFYAQSTGAVISGRLQRDRQDEIDTETDRTRETLTETDRTREKLTEIDRQDERHLQRQ